MKSFLSFTSLSEIMNSGENIRRVHKCLLLPRQVKESRHPFYLVFWLVLHFFSTEDVS